METVVQESNAALIREMHAQRIITSTAVFAATAHANQVRKELNEPYIIHPLRVGKMAAALGMDAEFIGACHLHDVVEDTNIPFSTIASTFPDRTARLVQAMTKFWQTGYAPEVIASNKDNYYRNILATEDAPLLKVLDRIDNLHDFAKMARLSAPKSHKWAAKYLAKTDEEFKPLLEFLTNARDSVSLQAYQWFSIARLHLETSL